jgi:hypothetical protein
MPWHARIPAALVAGALFLAGPALAADDPGVLRMEIETGQSAPIGPPPVRNLICDDPAIVRPVDAEGAPALKALRAGSTLCSFTDSLSVRRIYRVIVKDAGGGGSGPGGK